MNSKLFSRDDYPAPEEGAEAVGESVTDREVATSPEVVKPSTRSRKPTKRKATRRKATKKVAKAKVAKAPKTVAIQSVHPGVVVTTGPSGERYRWPKPGSIVRVAASDVDSVMRKNGSESRECCGSSTPPIYFLLVD